MQTTNRPDIHGTFSANPKKKSITVVQALTCGNVERVVDPWAVRHVLPAMEGNIDSAKALYSALSNEHRGLVLRAFWYAKAPRNVVRTLLSFTWEHDQQWLLHAFQTRARLTKLFKYAEFAMPELADITRVWRGTHGVSVEQAREGYSWTTDRDVACWFAIRHSTECSLPLVIYADVARSSIAYFTNDLSEYEAVLLTPPVAKIDLNAADWICGYERQCATIAASNREWMICNSIS